MPEPAPDPASLRARRIMATILTALFVGAVWWFVIWRSAPPAISDLN